jgi:hypothetical protein
MAYELFTGELDSEEKPGYALFTGELDEPVRRRDVTPFKVSVQEQEPPAEALAPARSTLTLPVRPGQAQSGVAAPEPIALAPQGKAPRMTTGTAAPKSNEYVPVVATIKGEPGPPLIERRGAPVSEEKFRQQREEFDAEKEDEKQLESTASKTEGIEMTPYLEEVLQITQDYARLLNKG